VQEEMVQGQEEEEKLVSQDVREEPLVIEEDKKPEPVVINEEEEESVRNESSDEQEEESVIIEEEKPVSQDVREEPLVIEEDKKPEPVVINEEEEESVRNESSDEQEEESVIIEEEKPVSQDVREEPLVIEEDKKPEPVVINEEEEESVRNESSDEQEEEQKIVVIEEDKEEEQERIMADKAEATLQEKNPATVEQSAIDTINFMLDLLQSDKFHPTSKIAEADRYSFSRNEEGGVQINDTYNKNRVVFEADKDNNVKVSDFQPDEKAKFTALFTRLQKDESKLKNIRLNSKFGDKLQSDNQGDLKPAKSAAEILQLPTKNDLTAIYEPTYPTADNLRDWTKDAYLTIEDPQERQETVSMLGSYLDKVNDPERYPLSEKDFQTVSTLERNSYDLRSTRDGVVTRDQAILDNPQVRAELALVNQPKPQVQRPVPAQSQR
jgi:hypothetical protein